MASRDKSTSSTAINRVEARPVDVVDLAALWLGIVVA